jgi:plasmid stabilization system protein ParE
LVPPQGAGVCTLRNESLGIRQVEIAYLPLALTDLEEIFHYLVNKLEAPQAARNLRDEINAAVHNLLQFPYAHALYRTEKPLKKEYRKITVKNFYIFYVVEKNTIEIHRVINSRRNIESVLE